MAACVGALAVREVALCVTGGHFFAVTLYQKSMLQVGNERKTSAGAHGGYNPPHGLTSVLLEDL
jgi:hypothetical protein